VTKLADTDALAEVLHKFICRALCRSVAMGALDSLATRWQNVRHDARL